MYVEPHSSRAMNLYESGQALFEHHTLCNSYKPTYVCMCYMDDCKVLRYMYSKNVARKQASPCNIHRADK